MHGFKSFVTLGLACLAAWASHIAPEYDNRRSIVDQSGAALRERAVPNKVEVQLWTDLGTGTRTDPTYKARLHTNFVGAPSHEDVLGYAKKAYENMMTQPDIKQRKSSDFLVAALYIPTTHSIFICSLPGSPAKNLIRTKGATEAPAWWSRVQHRTPLPLGVHAEDGAAYLYESSLKTKLAAGAKYPAGSFIAVWGTYAGLPVGKVRLCSGDGPRPVDPPCSVVFGEMGLGVGF